MLSNEHIREIAIRQKLKDDFKHYAAKCLKIRSKSGEIIPLLLNSAQLFAHEKFESQLASIGKVRALILKGRQEGLSTLVEGRFFHKVTFQRGKRAFILTHDQDATNNLFEMTQRYYNYCPLPVRPRCYENNAKELYFGKLDSGFKVGTAGNKAVGRSSTIQYFHGSEVAFWPNAAEHAKGILEAIADQEGTEIILESTANGLGNYFHQQWHLAQKGESEFIPIFIPWFWQTEYQSEVPDDFMIADEEVELASLYNLNERQLQWRRTKISRLSSSGIDGDKAFMQEYPCNAHEAFQASGGDSFIPSSLIMRARNDDAAKPYGPLVIGCDPARFGADRTSIIKRQGRVAYDLVSYAKKDLMEVCGILHRMIVQYNPAKVFIDVAGLGGGVVDRMRELGHDLVIVPVNGGERPLNDEKYLNKRAELWGEMKEWLMESPVKIPDSDSLHADLAGPSYKVDSKSRLVLEKKEDLKKRGLLSPDEGDCLSLTFAEPAPAPHINISKFQNNAKSFWAA